MGNTLEMSGLVARDRTALPTPRRSGQPSDQWSATGVAQCWRGVPTTSGAVTVLSNR